MGITSESPLLDAIFKMQQQYTNAIALAVCDQDDWLNWYQWECRMGDSPKQAGYDGKLRKIDTIKKLAALVKRGRER